MMFKAQTSLFERWFPYWLWEDYQNGMWEKRKNDMNKVQNCANLLADPLACEEAMRGALNAYPISAMQHLSKTFGKRPWLGQAACCFELGATEEETRIAWNFYMNKDQQDSANLVADKLIAEWERDNA